MERLDVEGGSPCFWWILVGRGGAKQGGKSRRRSRLVSAGLSLVPVSKPRIDGWVCGPVARRAEAVTADPGVLSTGSLTWVSESLKRRGLWGYQSTYECKGR